jgi:hypothetical protein
MGSRIWSTKGKVYCESTYIHEDQFLWFEESSFIHGFLIITEILFGWVLYFFLLLVNHEIHEN